MNDYITLDLKGRSENGRSRQVHLTGEGLREFGEKLEKNGLQTEAPLIVRALFLRGEAGNLDSRPCFNGNGWDGNMLEIHLAPGIGSKVAEAGAVSYTHLTLPTKRIV